LETDLSKSLGGGHSLLPSLALAAILMFSTGSAEAGRRSIRIDFGAWGPQYEIYPFEPDQNPMCPGAYVSGSPYFEPYYLLGSVGWNGLYFQTATFYGLNLNIYYCQHSKPYQAFANPSEYLNSSTFPEEERDLAHWIGANTDNAVTAIRYSFLGYENSQLIGRQWAFYFFPDELTVVALYGVPDDGSTYPYESISDFSLEAPDYLLWESVRDGFDGQYFCFQGKEYIGDCVPPAPPPPEEIFMNSFEE
jgi:hypothetical protein